MTRILTILLICGMGTVFAAALDEITDRIDGTERAQAVLEQRLRQVNGRAVHAVDDVHRLRDMLYEERIDRVLRAGFGGRERTYVAPRRLR